MKGRSFILLVLLLCFVWFAACGQPEEQVVDESELAAEIEERAEPGDMLLIPAGEFTMGTDVKPGNPPMAEPAHTVDLPAYEIDIYEVTNGQYARFQIESDYEAEGDWRGSYTIGK